MKPMTAPQPLRFLRRGHTVALANVPPDRTLLEVLRDDLGLTGTKEGCGEGDCGACTVVLGQVDGQGLRYEAVNSCIRLAHSVDGMALWTVEDLHNHPAQTAMVDHHGSQCGFCTPGFVMGLFGMYQNHVARGHTVTREVAQADLSGNLCRCTGYRPILDAAQDMAGRPVEPVDTAAVVRGLKRLQTTPPPAGHHSYLAPTTLEGLLRARAQHPDAQLVAGATDVGLWITKGHRRFERVLDVTRAAELQRVERYPHHIAIGAGVNLTQAFAALCKDRPQLQGFAERFAGLPVRNSGTLGGNVANGSPIGDSMPLLIALGASVVLMRWAGRGARGQMAHRELALEDLYTGYRQNVMRPDEIVAWIKVPKPTRHERLRVYKLSKRFDDDISAVCLALNLHIQNGVVVRASVGVGGVAATPVRASATEAALQGRPWNATTVAQAAATLQTEFQPISDMRASAAYRRTALGNLLQRYWLDSQGAAVVSLETLKGLSPTALEAHA
jgi:xanthine dehydrogenase small subunit